MRLLRSFLASLALVLACVLAGERAGGLLVRTARGLDPTGPEEARALDRVIPRALARIAPSILKVHPEADDRSPEGLRELARKTRTAIAIEKDLAVMDGQSIDATFVDNLVVEDFRGNVKKARLRGRDLRLRLVAIQVDEGGLVPAPRSTRTPFPGMFVFAAGSVLSSRGPQAAFGIVSATSRFEGRAIQVDAGVDPSNAGGGLVDLEGALVGIPVIVDRKIGDDSGVGFAVTPSRVDAVLERLRAGEELKPGMLGIALPIEEPHSEATARGVKVEGVLPNGAAKTAGIEVEDVILKLDGRALGSVRELVSALSERCAGDEVELVISRKGSELTKRVKLGAREARR